MYVCTCMHVCVFVRVCVCSCVFGVEGEEYYSVGFFHHRSLIVSQAVIWAGKPLHFIVGPLRCSLPLSASVSGFCAD